MSCLPTCRCHWDEGRIALDLAGRLQAIRLFAFTDGNLRLERFPARPLGIIAIPRILQFGHLLEKIEGGLILALFQE